MKPSVSRTIIIGLISILFISAASGLSPGADQGFLYLDLKEKRDKLIHLIDSRIRSVVRVVTYNDAGDISDEGTGVFVSSDGLIISNAHLFKNAYSASVSGSNGRFDNVTVEKTDVGRDLALIRVKADDSIPVNLGEAINFKDADKLYILSVVRDNNAALSAGTLDSAEQTKSDEPYFRINKGVSILSYPESSYGVVIDQAGRLAGLTRGVPESNQIFGTGIVVESPDSFYAVDVDTINAFLTSVPDAPLELAPAGKRVFFSWLMARAKSAFASAFVFLYELGFPKVMGIIIGVIILLVFIEWLIIRLKRMNPFRRNDI